MPDTAAERARIIERAKKMLNLQHGRGATQGEIQAAANLLQNLLRDHQLSMVDIESHQVRQEGVVQEIFESSFRRQPKWVTVIVGCVAEGFECHVVRSTKVSPDGSHRKLWHIIGLESDVAVARWFIDYLGDTLPRLASAVVAVEGLLGKRAARFRTNFIIGATTSIAVRLVNQRKDNEFGDAGCKALVHIKSDAVQAYVAREFPDLRKIKMKFNGSRKGLAEGAKAGNTIPLNRPVVGRPHTQALMH
jgi:hypothetical protein